MHIYVCLHQNAVENYWKKQQSHPKTRICYKKAITLHCVLYTSVFVRRLQKFTATYTQVRLIFRFLRYRKNIKVSKVSNDTIPNAVSFNTFFWSIVTTPIPNTYSHIVCDTRCYLVPLGLVAGMQNV